MKLKIEYVPTDKLAPYAHNAKLHDRRNIDAIAASIEQFGFDNPIGAWTNPDGIREIVFGHGRLLAAKQLGMDTVPVVMLDHLDDEARRALALVDNQTTLMTGFDMDELMREIERLGDFDLAKFGFDARELPTLDVAVDAAVDDDYDEPPDLTATAKRGQIWALGEHRLMCGDSTADDVNELMGGDKALLFITDPPYGVSYESEMDDLETRKKTHRSLTRKHNEIENDNLSGEDARDKLWVPSFKQALKHADDRCTYYIFSPQGGELMMMTMAIFQSGWQLKHTLVWVKNSVVLGRADYNYQHELILYGWNKVHDFYGAHPSSVIDDAKPDDLRKMKKDDLLEWALAMQKSIMDDANPDVLRFPKPLSSDLHPTMKPVPLLGHLIGNSTRRGDVVLDLYGGSGSTLIACEQMGRPCRMMEYSEHYCDVIIDRWERLTGKEAVLIE